MKIIVINGPNLNLLGKRDKKIYGDLDLEEINSLIKKTFPKVDFLFFQSNSEEKIIDLLQKADRAFDALLINPAAFTHYSIAIRDAFELVSIPKAVVHLSNISKREDFRKVDLLKELSDFYIAGEKEKGYIKAIEYLVEKK